MKVAIALALMGLAGCQASRPAANERMLSHAGPTLAALQAKLDVCGHNIANAFTVGFKATRVVLEDMPYTDGADGVRVGQGVRVGSARLDMGQGPLLVTARQMDVAIEGAGFFKVRHWANGDEGIAYTRAGNFTVNAEGQLVIASDAGNRLEPNITVPLDAESVLISSSGSVSVMRPGCATPEEIGQFQLARFVSPENLKSIGAFLYVETPGSGAPIEDHPAAPAFGMLHQGMLESSNVNVALEQIESLRTLNHYNAFCSACLGTPSVPVAIAPIDR